jgi:hypothetical protein
MRTTLTLDDDVARLLEQVRSKRGSTLKEVANEALREGLARLASPHRSRKPHATRAVSLGRCLVGNVDDVAEVLAVAEDEGRR